MSEQLGQILGVLFAALFNHLWQSTLFAAAMVGLALLLRRNSARVRYMLWLAASLKFLMPFALLAALGTLIPWRAEVGEPSALVPRVLDMAGDIAAPLAGGITYPQVGADARGMSTWQWTLLVLALVWVAGALFVALRWALRWLEIQRALWSSVKLTGIDFPARVRATTRQFEPGIVGIFRPVLLLPAGIEERLTPEQMRAVLAHERCHLRWRDNLTAWLHMWVETLFWFFPPVWWIGARMIEERERACDEQVTREGHAPDSYAEGILAVCEHYIASRLPCVSGVSGADLRQRVESIIRNVPTLKLGLGRKLVLRVIVYGAVAVPIVAGAVSGSAIQMLSGTYSAAIVEYFQLGIDFTPNPDSSVPQLGPGQSTCPGPDAEARRAQKDFARWVARLSADDGEKVLLFAVAANSLGDVQRLLASGAARSGDGLIRSDSLMHIAAEFADEPVLEALLQAGVGVDERGTGGIGGRGYTPLMTAISSRRLDNAAWLIRHGADVNAEAPNGYTALLLAMASCRDQTFVTQLIEAGARPNDRALRVAENTGFDVRTDASQPPPALQGWSTTRVSRVRADFDGDGEEDVASLRLSDDGLREGLFVALSSIEPYRLMQIAETRPRATPATRLFMEISVAKPDTYRTACSKGYGRGKGCAEGEPTEAVLKQPGIWFAMPESASSILYWDASTREFKRVWTSD